MRKLTKLLLSTLKKIPTELYQQVQSMCVLHDKYECVIIRRKDKTSTEQVNDLLRLAVFSCRYGLYDIASSTEFCFFAIFC